MKLGPSDGERAKPSAAVFLGRNGWVSALRWFEMRQVELACALGTTQAQLSKYEWGKNVPTLEFLLELKRFSGKSIDWILTGEH